MPKRRIGLRADTLPSSGRHAVRPAVAPHAKATKRKAQKHTKTKVAAFGGLLAALFVLPGGMLSANILTDWRGSGAGRTASEIRPYDVTGPVRGDLAGNVLQVGETRVFLDVFARPDTACRAEGRRYSCSALAGARLAQWTRGRDVTCRMRHDAMEGRMVGRCLDGETDLNARLVAEGLAFPDFAFGRNEADVALQVMARERGLGYYADRLRSDHRDYVSPTERAALARLVMR